MLPRFVILLALLGAVLGTLSDATFGAVAVLAILGAGLGLIVRKVVTGRRR